MLRRTIILMLAPVVFVVAALVVGDIFARIKVQQLIAQRIEHQVPGSHATVKISSFPFVGHLLVSGSVSKVSAHVTGVTEGGFTFAAVDVDVTDLALDRTKLLQGKVQVSKVTDVVVQATMDQAALDRVVGQPVVLGQGTVGLASTVVAASVSVSGNVIHIGPNPGGVSVTVPALSLLPCVSGAVVSPGQMVISCTTTTVPPAFSVSSLTG